MAKGWISLHRSIQDNELWKEKPFDKARAWIDLLMLADSSDSKDGKYKKGTVYRGKEFLSKRWGWSVGKVTRFLDDLEEKNMIMQVKRQGGWQNGNILTIVNYSKYQNQRKQDRRQDKTQDDMPTINIINTDNSDLPSASEVLYGGW